VQIPITLKQRREKMTRYICYVWEQLYSATSFLATSPLGLRERLLDAVLSRVQKVIHPSPTETIPLDIFERLCSLEQELTKSGSFKETIEKMEDREVEKTIDDIVGLFSMVARAYPEELKGQLSLR
jgi:hypothetical protein